MRRSKSELAHNEMSHMRSMVNVHKNGDPNINMKHNCPAASMWYYFRPLFFNHFQSLSRLHFSSIVFSLNICDAFQ